MNIERKGFYEVPIPFKFSLANIDRQTNWLKGKEVDIAEMCLLDCKQFVEERRKKFKEIRIKRTRYLNLALTRLFTYFACKIVISLLHVRHFIIHNMAALLLRKKCSKLAIERPRSWMPWITCIFLFTVFGVQKGMY